MDEQLLRFRKDATYCLIDLETFNLALNFQQNRPRQVGVLEVKGEEIINSLDINVNWPEDPHLKIGEGAKRHTKYDPITHNKTAIYHQDALDKFWPILCRSDYILGHNVLGFDLYLLRGWAEMAKREWKWMVPKIIDTDALSRGYKLDIKYDPKKDDLTEYQYRMGNTIVRGCKTNLTAMGKEFGIAHDYDSLHNAVSDIELNLKVWNVLKYKVEI